MPMKEKALQVLLVEDNAGEVPLLREMFSKERADSFELTHCLRMGEAERHLAKGGVDIVLLDMGLPDGHGLDTVRRAHAAAPGVPVIVLTGLDDEALAAEAMKEGAQDFRSGQEFDHTIFFGENVDIHHIFPRHPPAWQGSPTSTTIPTSTPRRYTAP